MNSNQILRYPGFYGKEIKMMKSLMFAAALALVGGFSGGAGAAERQLDAVGSLTVSSTGFLGLGSTKCAATLIKPDMILTAAHCLIDGDEYVTPSDVTFHAQGGQESVKIKRFIRTPSIEVMVAQGGIAPVQWAFDWATAELETALPLTPLPLAPASWSVVHSEQLEMHVVGIPDRIIEHQDSCFSSPLWERDSNSWAERTTRTLRESGHALARFLPEGRQADYTFWLDIGAMAHTCNIRPGYSGGPTLIKHPKHGFMVVGVNVSGTYKHSEAEIAAMYEEMGGKEKLEPGERAAFGVSASMISCIANQGFFQFCEAGSFSAIMRRFYREFMTVYDRHQVSFWDFEAISIQTVKCGYSDTAVGINAYLDSGGAC